MKTYFATAPKGLEQLLADELTALGAQECKVTLAGVSFAGELETVCRAIIWSRLASRVLIPLTEFEAADPDALYAGVKAVDWPTHFSSRFTFAVDAAVNRAQITHSRYAALRVKDAIVDRFREHSGERPSVDRDDPDIRINLYLFRDKATLSLDLGGPLHQRGYRQEAGAAPLKENLAAAILIRASWPELARQQSPLIDPMCGSGTLLIEAMMMAADVAPRVDYFCRNAPVWLGLDADVWNRVLDEALERRKNGLERMRTQPLTMIGADADRRVLHAARANIARAGLNGLIRLENRKLQHWKPAQIQDVDAGLIIVNPPYGERLGELTELTALYGELGQTLANTFPQWQAGVFTGNPNLGKQMGLRSRKRYKFFNGALPCELLLFEVSDEWKLKRGGEAIDAAESGLSAGAVQFANRLRKNHKHLGKWARKEGLEAWRVYDADLPDYNVAIDLYHDHMVVQEYKAPKDVPVDKAQRRLLEVLRAAPETLGIERNKVIVKERAKQKGKSQYKKQDDTSTRMEVKEYGLSFLVNLHDYLDTGLFSDHRPIRKTIREVAEGKRFLNLFAYTGTATVAAAAGGAASTVTVDMSHRYTEWALDNMKHNGFGSGPHRYIQADCVEWLEAGEGEFDLIFLDPPTFSNSKRMNKDFEVQRDHVSLIKLTAELLAKDGLLIFSNNFRGFKLDQEALEKMGLSITDITKKTIPKDYERRTGIHHCFEIRKN